jgi:hypothetical protein
MDEDQIVNGSSPLEGENQEVKDSALAVNARLGRVKDAAIRQEPPAQPYNP